MPKSGDLARIKPSRRLFDQSRETRSARTLIERGSTLRRSLSFCFVSVALGYPFSGCPRQRHALWEISPYGDATSTKPHLSDFTGSPPIRACPHRRDPPRPVPMTAQATGNCRTSWCEANRTNIVRVANGCTAKIHDGTHLFSSKSRSTLAHAHARNRPIALRHFSPDTEGASHG
jgi:hypothetical protein